MARARALVAGLVLGLSLGCTASAPPSSSTPAPAPSPSTIRVEPVELPPDQPLGGAGPGVDEALGLFDPVCRRTLDETSEGFRLHRCHPSSHGPLEVDADAEQLEPEVEALLDELVRAAELDEAGMKAVVLLEGGPGVSRVRDALLERGLGCDQIYTWPKNSSDRVTLFYVCPICCLL